MKDVITITTSYEAPHPTTGAGAIHAAAVINGHWRYASVPLDDNLTADQLHELAADRLTAQHRYGVALLEERTSPSSRRYSAHRMI